MENIMKIKRKSGVSAYKQIYLHYINLINNEEILENQQLPAERELAKSLAVSRGTIKKAYELLILNGYATAEQGSGTFAINKNKTNMFKRNRAKQQVDILIDHLIETGFDYNEITSLIKVRLSNKQNQCKKINIAAVDCNLESLSIIKNQLSYVENINFMGFLLNDVLNYSHPEDIFDEFEVIFTTSTHYEELKEFISKFENKIVKAVMSTNRETIFKIANVSSIENMCVITETERFAQIIKSNLRYLNLKVIDENFLITKELSKEKLNQFLSNKKTLIIPPFYAMDFTRDIGDEILNFGNCHGEIITFNYTIEKGSLIYIEEKVADVLANRHV